MTLRRPLLVDHLCLAAPLSTSAPPLQRTPFCSGQIADGSMVVSQYVVLGENLSSAIKQSWLQTANGVLLVLDCVALSFSCDILLFDREGLKSLMNLKMSRISKKLPKKYNDGILLPSIVRFWKTFIIHQFCGTYL